MPFRIAVLEGTKSTWREAKAALGGDVLVLRKARRLIT